MPDYSTYFRIHNRLDIDLQLQDDKIPFGYWEKKPNGGLVPAFSVSDEFQVKDKAVWPEGTEADMYFRGSRGDRKISIHVYFTCPWGNEYSNAADCTSDSSQLLCSVSGLNSKEPKYHPLNGKRTIVSILPDTYTKQPSADFIIDRRVK
ncbi:hypothetical protein ACEPAF_65 [Sanghuangporus sanghuang]